MGIRFRKSFKVAPGVRATIGKKSGSVSIGGKGVRLTQSTTGRRTKTVGVPGTGLAWSSSRSTRSKSKAPATVQAQGTELDDDKLARRKVANLTIIGIAAVCVILIILIGS